jgi:hypothetical protein
MKTGDETVDSMFDEIAEVTVKPDGKVEARLVDDASQEMESAVAEFRQSWRRFREIDERPNAATDPNRHPGMEWWKRHEWLSISDNRLKEAFCGRDRSPRSIAQYHRFRLNVIGIGGKSLRADA